MQISNNIQRQSFGNLKIEQKGLDAIKNLSQDEKRNILKAGEYLEGTSCDLRITGDDHSEGNMKFILENYLYNGDVFDITDIKLAYKPEDSYKYVHALVREVKGDHYNEKGANVTQIFEMPTDELKNSLVKLIRKKKISPLEKAVGITKLLSDAKKQNKIDEVVANDGSIDDIIADKYRVKDLDLDA